MSVVFVPPGDCPNCGEEVPAGAKACPHCGADENAGWNDDAYLDGVDLPGVDDSAGEAAPRGRMPVGLTVVVALCLVLALSGVWVLRR